jgi:hypothetical protein
MKSLFLSFLFAGFWASAAIAMPPFPSEFIFEYHWQAGSMPPPYHYEYSVEINAKGEGTIHFSPDYPGVGSPHWTRYFTLPREELNTLYQDLDRSGAFSGKWKSADNHIVGGSLEWMSATVDGEVSSIPSTRTADSDHRASAIFKQIRSVIPPLIMNELIKLREKYEQDYEK